MKILTVVGARPQFVKAAVVSRELVRLPDAEETLVHTGQHYDERMSSVFFEQLGIPTPKHNLHAGSGSHGSQTAAMLTGLERVLLDERPDVVLVYGDTNSTLAGTLAASKLQIPVAHVESGLRSYNRCMPEEVNRLVADRLADVLFCPTQDSVACLAAEGIRDRVYLVGDVMYDAAMIFSELAEKHVDPVAAFGLEPEQYVLMTCHRAENTDDRERLSNILRGVSEIARDMPVLFPVHPRTRKVMAQLDVSLPEGMRLVEPISYFEMLILERRAALVVTDSGGVQKEAFFFRTPCVTVREETEWTETVEAGANVLAGGEQRRIVDAARAQLARQEPIADPTPHYGGRKAAERIARHLAEFASRSPTSSDVAIGGVVAAPAR